MFKGKNRVRYNDKLGIVALKTKHFGTQSQNIIIAKKNSSGSFIFHSS